MTDLLYAGIGSRKTPPATQAIMSHVACYLYSEGWTLRSGAAECADEAFEAGVDHMLDIAGVRGDPTRKEIYLPWAGYNNSKSELHARNYPFSEQEQSLAGQLHPAWDKCSPSAKLLHQRNNRIMLGTEAVTGPIVKPVKFVVCWTEGGAVSGGTGQALRIAEMLEIPVINLGKARNAEELEAMVLEVDKLQAEFKKKLAA